MSSMSYCVFENTSIDLRACVEAMAEADEIGDLDLNQYEKEAARSMLRLAKQYIDEYERLTGV